MTDLPIEDRVSESENGTGIKVVCGVMGGIITTALFLWMTFPRDLATNATINNLGSQIQKQIDQVKQEADENREAVQRQAYQMGQVRQKLNMNSDR